MGAGITIVRSSLSLTPAGIKNRSNFYCLLPAQKDSDIILSALVFYWVCI
jgi:hypothetical protein